MKSKRHALILELIEKEYISTQEDLLQKLREHGFDVTQATVSRDIRQMKLTKQVTPDGRQKYVYTTADPEVMHDKYVSVIKAGYVSMDVAGNLLVIRTVSGMAMAVAAAIDALDMPEIVGCIAGDDTIFVAIKSNEVALELMEKYKGVLNRG